ncbi:hypothetical protein FHL15_006102 [Xylaria flabelliformis]|uniref:Uncharacterized protein n=1 Tax=Xylaria flabelliformis TaxID=2512241 RepID=A0A553HYD1_9PEZI|nr:hypothetical protein FHL15_006102 [Xylaria flabelliformis]
MAPDVSFSTTSPDCATDEDGSTDPDDCSSVSDDHMHIGVSPRPPLPLSFPSNAISKSLPSKLAAGFVSRGAGPVARSQSAHPHPKWKYQHASGPPPRPPPPPHPPPSLTRPLSNPPSIPLEKHDKRRSGLAELRYRYDNGSHGNDRDSFFSSVRDGGEPEVEVEGQSEHVQRLREHYAVLNNQRSSLLGKFKNALSQRAHVHRLRQSKDEVDKKFMAAARALLPETAQLHQLHQLFNAMQNTHVGYQEAEQRLEKVMDELQHNQEELQLQEAAFYKTAVDALGTALLSIDEDQDSLSVKSEDVYLRGISGDRPEIIHPLYEKLRAAFGELQLAKELLVNTQMKRAALHARKTQPLTEDGLDLLETYGDAGKKKALELRAMALMTEEDVEQLQEYDMLEQDARQGIEIYTERVRILQQECRDASVLPLSSHFQQEGFGLDSFYRDEIRLPPSPFDSNDESVTLAHPVFPLLLSNPTHLLQGFPQTSLQSLRRALQLPLNAPVRAKQVKEAAREANMHSLLSTAESEDKTEYINRWLLHKLHHSAMEAELLWTTFRSRLKILDIDRWQRDVLNFWWRDDLIDPMSVGTGDNGTDRASKFVGSRVEFNTFSYSDSGQLDGLRSWKLDDSWL